MFSTTACGTYGFENLKLAQTGTTAPVGQISLEAAKEILVRDGSGWLLLVNAAPASPASTK